MATPVKRRRARTAGVKTLQTLADLYFECGFECVQGQLARQFTTGAIDRSWWLLEEGRAAYRTDVGESKYLDFTDFSPPPLWQTPYAISLAHFSRPEQRHFSHLIYHGKEEILLPIDGAVQYSFFHSPGGEPAKLKSLPRPVTDKSIIRINPQVPHSTVATTEEATAWMIFRDAANTSARLVRSGSSVSSVPGKRGKGGDQEQHAEGQRLVSQEKLGGSGGGYKYALIAWNIAELIRNARLQSALSLEQLGRLVGMDRTSLSRLERADLNIRLDRLFAICNELDLDIAASIKASVWHYDTDDLPRFSGGVGFEALLRKPRMGHRLRTFIVDLKKGQKSRIDMLHHSTHSSWITLRGRLIVDLPSPGQRELKSLVIGRRAVLHFRSPGREESDAPNPPELFVSLQAVEDSRFLVVTSDHDDRQ